MTPVPTTLDELGKSLDELLISYAGPARSSFGGIGASDPNAKTYTYKQYGVIAVEEATSPEVVEKLVSAVFSAFYDDYRTNGLMSCVWRLRPTIYSSVEGTYLTFRCCLFNCDDEEVTLKGLKVQTLGEGPSNLIKS
jgi:hypothetical protein